MTDVLRPCPTCGGHGQDPMSDYGNNSLPCTTCRGTGKVTDRRASEDTPDSDVLVALERIDNRVGDIASVATDIATIRGALLPASRGDEGRDAVEGGRRWQKRPVVIEAMEWTGDNLDALREWGAPVTLLPASGGASLIIGTLEDGPNCEAVHIASLHDRIIRGVQGEYYPVKPDIFAATYQRPTPDSSVPEERAVVGGQKERDAGRVAAGVAVAKLAWWFSYEPLNPEVRADAMKQLRTIEAALRSGPAASEEPR